MELKIWLPCYNYIQKYGGEKYASERTRMPVCINSPPGELPLATRAKTSLVHFENPHFFASASIPQPMTCSVSPANTTKSSFWASFAIAWGLQSFPAWTAAISIWDQRKGDCQFVCFDCQLGILWIFQRISLQYIFGICMTSIFSIFGSIWVLHMVKIIGPIYRGHNAITLQTGTHI